MDNSYIKNRTKFAILGKLDTKFQCQYFNNPEWIILSMGKHHDEHLIPRVDKWFDIHLNPTNVDKNTVHRAEFPMEECEELVGGKYFNNTMSYLIAYAILQGATDIAFYGSRFETDHDLRAGQYHNVRELIFFAKGRGINVTAYDEVILKDYPYSGKKDFDS